MNTSITAQKSNLQPLTNARKNPHLPIQDNPENIERIDRVGWFDKNPVEKGFDANSGGQIIFNLPKIEIPQSIQKAWEGEGPSKLDPNVEVVSDLFKNGASVTFGAVQRSVGAAEGEIKDILGAVGDLVKNEVAFKNPTEQQSESGIPQDNTAKKAAAENQYINQKQEATEAEISAVHRKIDTQAQLTPLRQDAATLTGLPEWLSDIVNEKGEARIDLQTPIAQKKREILETQQANKNPLSSPAKHGAEGPRLSTDDNKSSETHSTAQTATG